MNSIRQCKPLLGTYVEIHIEADESDDSLLDRSLAAFDEIGRIQELMSFHDPESELSRINRTAHLEVVEISHDLWRVFVFAQKLYRSSGGYFDPTIGSELVRRELLPNHGSLLEKTVGWDAVLLTETSVQFAVPLSVDLGGIAKGYAVDRALDVIGADVNSTVNAGGDLAMNRWQGREVEIRTPGSGGRQTITLPMENGSLATSAAYFLETQSVIFNPLNRCQFLGEESVSVFADSCMVADALTKVAFLMPNPGLLIRKLDAAAFIITLEGEVRRL